jgi:WXG100 family type VII secretion target
MGSRTIMVTPEQLETAAGKIESLASDYQSQYNALYGKTDALASTWQGDDNKAFVDQIEGFKEDFLKMYNLMNEYASYLRTTAKQYRTTQEQVVSQAKSLVN